VKYISRLKAQEFNRLMGLWAHKLIGLSCVLCLLLASADFAPAYRTVQFVSEFGGKGEALGKFSDETRLAFDKDGNIYMLDMDSERVQKLDPDGRPIMEIATGTEFRFERPMDIAVDGDLNVYIVDWKSVHIQGTDSPRIFNYGPCVHKFSRDVKFIATFTLEDLSRKAAEKERAVPAVDTDGNFALMIMPQKLDRQLYISADAEGNVYVLDQDTIHKLSGTGEVLSHFAEPGGGPGQLDKATGISVDTEGNVYVADTGNHRISKFGPDGRFLLSFGKEGDADGCLMGALYVTAASDGTVLVADSARYEKTLRTSLKHRKLINSTILVTGQDDPLIPRTRDFETVIRRFQRFDENGGFQEKILYRIDKSDPELRDMEFKAIDPSGNLYLIDKDRLVIRKYSAAKLPVQWSAVEKTLTYRFEHSKSRYQIDDFYDLNDYFDFDERQKYTQMTATMRLNYDMTETFRVRLVSSLMRLVGEAYDKYPGEYADPHGFIQDDETIDDYIAARMRLDLSLILDHDPFKYRVGDLFVYFGGGRYNFDIKATDPTFQNKRQLDEDLWWAVWAAGVRYDMGSSLRFSLIAAQHRPPGFMNYDYKYWDEEGELYGTGFGSGASTEVFISIDGALR
jgi:DNA-binding beta-propeller fold protein YncE